MEDGINKMNSEKSSYLYEIIFLLVSISIGTLSALEFLNMHHAPPLYPADNLSKIEKLSIYNPNLVGSSGDTDIYYFESGQPGGKVLILGGTHPNEPAGFLTAYLILENLKVTQGTVIIIPRANNSAFTHNDPQEGQPQTFTINGKKGPRKFRFGSRITNPIDQWLDPEIYLHRPSGQKLAGNETRNLNRSYPGVKDGTKTEQVCFAIVALIKKQNIDLAFDLHEAAPEYPVVNAIVAPERTQDITSEATIELEFEGLIYSIEPSPYNFRGLSHREWQDFTNTLPVLLETANPLQGRLRGKSDVNLLLTGKDPMYMKAAELGELAVPYDSLGITIEVRVGRHLEAVKKIMNIFSHYHPEKTVQMENIPSYSEINAQGIGVYF